MCWRTSAGVCDGKYYRTAVLTNVWESCAKKKKKNHQNRENSLTASGRERKGWSGIEALQRHKYSVKNALCLPSTTRSLQLARALRGLKQRSLSVLPALLPKISRVQLARALQGFSQSSPFSQPLRPKKISPVQLARALQGLSTALSRFSSFAS